MTGVGQGGPPPVHVRCGTDVFDRFAAAGIEGPALRYADPVAQGPLPGDCDEAELVWIRAAFVAEAYGLPPAGARAALEADERNLARAAAEREAEVVLWFEHDLFDQAILARVLARLAPAPPPRLSLVTADRHPDLPRFVGLGQLDPGQLRALFETRQPVTPEMLALGGRAWEAFRAPTPRPLEALAAADPGALPFLAAALRRHLAELPGVGDGLARTERLALEALAGGPVPGRALFAAVQAREAAPWLGDVMFFHVLRGLAGGPRPLVQLAGPLPTLAAPGGDPAVALTAAGGEVLAGRVDRVPACGIDAWVGGVRLEGHAVAWRWDPAAGAVVGPPGAA